MQRRHFLNFSLSAAASSMALGSLAVFVSGCSKKKLTPIAPGSTVLALGDSLTEGYGAPASASYPTVLAQLTGWKIINGGVSGDVTADALGRLPALLAEHQPQLVLTGIGGNDILRKVPEPQIRTNIVAICQQIKNSGAQNMLIALPKFSALGAAIGALSDHPLYKEIAQEMNLPLLESAWSKILSNDNLKSDAIHANAQGYTQFANLLAKHAKETGLLRT